MSGSISPTTPLVALEDAAGEADEARRGGTSSASALPASSNGTTATQKEGEGKHDVALRLAVRTVTLTVM